MNKKKFLIFLIILFLFVNLVLISACHSKDDDENKFSLKEDSFSFSPKLKFVSWANNEKCISYDVLITPKFHQNKILLERRVEKPFLILSDECLEWQEIIISVCGNDEEENKTNTISFEINFAQYDDFEEDIKFNPYVGKVDSYNDNKYYYVKQDTNIYILKNLELDYAIVLNNAINVKSLNAIALDGSMYSYNKVSKLLVIKKEYINQFSLGARIPFEIIKEDNSSIEFNIFIVKNLPYELDKDKIQINRAQVGSDIEVLCKKDLNNSTLMSKVNKITLDGVILDSKHYYGNSNGNGIALKKSFLNGLSCGEHEVRVYYDDASGRSTIKIDVKEGSKNPYNLSIDFDSDYPNVYITWDLDYKYHTAIVTIKNDENRVEYASENFPELFNGNSFNARGLISKQDAYVSLKVNINGFDYLVDAPAILDEDLNETAQEYLENSFNYLGRDYNKFILDEKELDDFVAYSIINFEYGDDDIRDVSCSIWENYTIYAPYLVRKHKGSKDLIKNDIKTAYNNFIDPLRYNIEVLDIEGNVVSYKVNLRSGAARPYNEYNGFYKTYLYREYPNVKLHYYDDGESQRDENYKFKVDYIEDTAQVYTSTELYLALEKGLRPIVVENSSAEKVYNKAREVLIDIIDDRMSEYEKVLAIYDWISYCVIYDRGLTDRTSNIKESSEEYASLYRNTSFFAEGVFNSHIAVCNGIAAAFSIMANIEGIRCLKTMGKVSSGNHTWVKVYVDGEWYICDPTWASTKDESDKSQYYEYISYEYFMMSLDESKEQSSRREYTQYPAGLYYAGISDYDYHASNFVVYNGKVLDHYIVGEEDFIELMDYYFQLGENRVIKSQETIQFSVKMIYTEIGSFSHFSYATRVELMLEAYKELHKDVENNFEIEKIFSKSNQSEFVNIRIKGK